MNTSFCLTNMLVFVHSIYEDFDKVIPSDLKDRHFQNAFYKVLQERFLREIRSVELGHHLCAWIKEWISGRRQLIVLSGHPSEWLPVTS